MTAISTQGFDYSQVEAGARDGLLAATARIKVRMARTADDIIEIGRDLIAVKEAIGHGNFLPWIEAEFGMSDQSAANFMNVAKRFGGQNPNGLDFTPTVLYALAAPSTPDEVVDAAVERAGSGAKLTTADVKAMKAAWAAEREELRAKAGKARAAEQDFEQQAAQLRDRLAKERSANEALRFEVEHPAPRPEIEALPNVEIGEDNEVVVEQANAILLAWSLACPSARQLAYRQMST